MRLLKRKEKEKLLEKLEERFGFKEKMNYYFFEFGGRKIKILSPDFEKLDLEGMVVENLGMYFARWDKDEVRLSIEGSQLVAKHAKKNVVELDEEKCLEWMSGKTIEVKAQVEEGFVILKCKDYVVGCGRYSKGRILSFVPKWRRVKLE